VSTDLWAHRRFWLLLFPTVVGLTMAAADTPVGKQILSGSHGATVTIEISSDYLVLTYQAPNFKPEQDALFLALGTHREIGSAVLPFQHAREGSTVFLPFKADLLVLAQSGTCSERRWENWRWGEPASSAVETKADNRTITIRVPRPRLGSARLIDCAIYAKDLSQNDGWGNFFGCNDPAASTGTGDKYVATYLEIDLAAKGEKVATVRTRLNSAGTKMRIYQLFVRLFGNTNETRQQNGPIDRNGVGKFADINDKALKSLRDFGFTHIWLTGVLQQATATDYSQIGQPADDPDLLKGLAGSPYAIKDYFDVCPDYATDPKTRVEEFKSLLARIHAQKMKALIDFVPNHVARSYNSDVKPDQNFGSKGNGGAGDDMSVFFSPRNNFFYLQPDGSGPPLKLPTCKDGQAVSPTCKVLAEMGGARCDGYFSGEKDHGKVTGNNKASWTPDINDWYETAKLNYGFDFTKADKSVREYPNANTPNKAIPDTWQKMDSVIAYWQASGVDGFRCDMSHMVPPEFWNWVISRARARHPDVVFIGEAYDNDPAKVPGVDPIITQLNGGKSNVMFDLLDAGFNAVYDDPTYRAIKKIYEGPGWANDIDDARPDAFIFENSLRYAENHDEVRLAAKSQWGGIGMKVGLPVSAILYGLSRGPIMLYNGQEVGEPAIGVEGFGNEDARTTIFDYWSMPELVKWVNDRKYDGGRLSKEQKDLRSFYVRLVNLVGESAFRDGICLQLNAANRDNPAYGRLGNEQASGHWLYSFLRYDPVSGQRFLVAVNLNPTSSLKDVQVRLPEAVTAAIGLNSQDRNARITIKDRLNVAPLADVTLNTGYLRESGIPIAEIPPLGACYLEIKL
jgi:glycosidase